MEHTKFEYSLRDDAIYFSGIIDEYANLKQPVSMVNQKADFSINLSEISYINSYGIRSWINFISEVSHPMELHNCSPVMTEQFLMIPEVTANCLIRSIVLETNCYHCSFDSQEEIVFKDWQHKKDQVPQLYCPNCSNPMEMNLDVTIEELVESLSPTIGELQLLKSYEERKPISTMVEVISKSNNEVNTYFARDISMGGIFIYMDNPYTVGQKLDVNFTIPHFKEQVSVSGEVVWKFHNKELGGIGINFYNMPANMDDKVRKYIDLFYHAPSPLNNRSAIMVVEDDKDIVELFKYLLAAEGFKVFTAPDGAAALKLFPNIQVGLIISDIKMPRLDGLSLMDKITAIGYQEPYIIISATCNAEEIMTIRGRPQTHFLKKPFDIDELVRLIHDVLS